MGADLVHDGAATVVTLDWPARRNALGPDEAAALTEALEGAHSEPAARGVVLTGEGGAFCAGGDLVKLLVFLDDHPEEVERFIYSSFQGVIRAILACPIPVFAAVDGPAIGFGMDIALACDRRIVGPSGWFKQGWGAYGLIPGTGGMLLLERLVGRGTAFRLWSQQSRVGGPEAQAIGLGEATEATARSEAVKEVQALATLPRGAVEANTALAREGIASVMEDHLRVCLRTQLELLQTAEFRRRAERITVRQP